MVRNASAPVGTTQALLGASRKRRSCSHRLPRTRTPQALTPTPPEAELRSLAALDVPATADGATAGGVLLPCPALRTTLSPVDVAAELISSLRSQARGGRGEPLP